MSESSNADEILAAFIAAMGQELGKLFRATSDELCWIHYHWHQYRVLFGVKPSRIDLLNEAGPFFFRVVQDVLLEDTLLGIARLVGPPETFRHPNLAVRRFSPLITDLELRDEISTLAKNAEACAGFATGWRNRHLAHRDLALALKAPAEPLKLASREEIEKSLSALREVLNCIEVWYCGSTREYSICDAPGDAMSLLGVIKSGIIRRRERMARLKRGEFHGWDESEEI